MKITIETDAAGATRTLERISGNAGNLRPFFGAAATEFHRIERARFASRGQNTWVPLAQITLRRKRRRGMGRGILVATGALRRSLTSPVARGSVMDIGPTEAEMGTDLPYAKYQDRRRPLIDISRRDVGRFARLFTDHLLDGVDA